MVYAAMDLDIWEVIAAARTKPFGFMPFYPGPGLGGHCIPIDPFYLAWKARQSGQRTRFVELAGEINTAMPRHVLGRVMEALRSRRQPIRGSRVLVLGLAYKPDVDDTRESPALPLLHLLKRRGAKVAYHDPHIPVLPPTRRFPQLAGMRSIPWQRDAISAFDAVLVVTAHAAVNYRQLGRWSKCVIDTRNVMAAVKTPAGTVWKA
jgi:UDP-N-acetyl-D-glucosamine dehydrogenase